MSEPVTAIHQLVERNAQRFGSSLALIDHDGREFTWQAFSDCVDEAEAALAKGGLTTGDRLMIVAENAASVAAFLFAASRIGAITVPVNARMSARELERITAHANPRIIVYTTGVSKDAAGHAAEQTTQELDEAFGRVELSVTGINDPEPTPQGTTPLAVLLYTTGTTGAPKGVMLTQKNLLFAGETSASYRGMTKDDVVYGALPLTHVFGLASMLIASASIGAAVQLEARFKPDRLLSALQDKVTILPAVPQMHALLMKLTEDMGLTRLSDTQLRYVSSGAAPLDPAWKRKAEAFYQLPLQNGYGMTESTAGICGTRSPIGSPDISVGPPLPGVEIDLDEAIGSENGVGEILTKGPHVMLGYFRNPDETAKALQSDGFLRTGDLGKIDEDGRLHVVGRAKELIIRSGFNVYPPEVEAALNDHPDVIQSAVIGRRTSDGNEDILAFVQCAVPAKLDIVGLEAFAAERLTAYKRPSRIVPTEQLPAASTGKILKHKLLEVFSNELG